MKLTIFQVGTTNKLKKFASFAAKICLFSNPLKKGVYFIPKFPSSINCK